MTWLDQMRHVFVKDLREVRWPLLAYIVFVGLVTIGTTSRTPLGVSGLGELSYFVVIAGLLLTAAVILTDSPTRPDAFWAAQPLRPSAVLAAKVAFAVLLIVIGAVGQAIALRSFDIDAAQLPWMLARSAKLYAAWLLAAMVMAAVMPDLRSFVVWIVAVPLVLFLSGALLVGTTLHVPAVLVARLDVLGVLLGFAMLAWLYETRGARRGARAAGFLVALIALLTLGMRAPTRPDEWALGDVRVAPLRLEVPQNGINRTGMGLSFMVRGDTLSDAMRLTVVQAEVELHLRDGAIIRTSAEPMPIGPMASIPEAPRLRWLQRRDGPRAVHLHVMVRVTPDQRRLLERGLSSVVFEGRAIVTEAVTLAVLPLVPGADTTVSGHSVRVENWSTEFGEPTLRLRVSSVSTEDLPRRVEGWHMAIDPALVNSARGEAYRLAQRGGTAAQRGLVLPGLPAVSRIEELGLAQTVPARSPVDAEWLREARLLLVGHEVRGSYPVRLELEL